MGESIYPELNAWFTERNDGVTLVPAKTDKGTPTASRKLKIQTKMVSIVKASLKEIDAKAYKIFVDKMNTAGEVTTEKRFFMGEYGFSNVKNVLLGKEKVLTKAEKL